MQRFNDQLTAQMSLFGRTITCKTFGSSGGSVTLSTLDGTPAVEVEYEGTLYDRISGQVKFLDSTFRPSKKTDRYDVDRAVGLLLSYEAKTRQKREKAAEEEKILQAYNQRRREALDISRRVSNPAISIGVPYDYERKYYTITIKVEDIATLSALVDYIQDSGFLAAALSAKSEDE